MVTQKPISLKIDTSLLEQLDKEASLGFKKRNWHINRAIRVYLELQDARRIIKCAWSENSKNDFLNRWLREWFPEAATW